MGDGQRRVVGRRGRLAALAALLLSTVWLGGSLAAPAGAADPPVVANDAYSATAGTTVTIPAPGVLANDDPLPDGLHLHLQSTLTESFGYITGVTITDDGTLTFTVPATTTPGGLYDLAYCMGPSTTVGTTCTSNQARVDITVTAPTVANDTYSATPGTTVTIPAPGVLANDDPLPDGLHLHLQSTLTESFGYITGVTITDDGTLTFTVPPTTTPGLYDLAYCMGPSTTVGTTCTSNQARVDITVAEPVPSPAIALEKTVMADDGNGTCAATDTIAPVLAGTTVRYCYRVTNTGDTPLNSHDLDDDQLAPSSPTSPSRSPPAPAPSSPRRPPSRPPPPTPPPGPPPTPTSDPTSPPPPPTPSRSRSLRRRTGRRPPTTTATPPRSTRHWSSPHQASSTTTPTPTATR